jgi:hypothetical protein
MGVRQEFCKLRFDYSSLDWASARGRLHHHCAPRREPGLTDVIPYVNICERNSQNYIKCGDPDGESQI